MPRASKTPITRPPEKALIGMVHVGALPGSPRAGLSVDRLVQAAVADATALIRAGFDGLIVENMHDAPYMHGEHGPETTAVMTRVGLAVREVVRGASSRSRSPSFRLGVQVLSGGNREALAVALACGLDFIRCENFVFSHVADEGLLSRAEAGPLLRYRRSIGADGARPERRRVDVFCDIKKKHASHSITADLSLAETARAAEFFGADGLIVTGTATGEPTDPNDLAEVRSASRLPLFVGSGVTADDAADLLKVADGLIVGSSIKRGGHWTGPVDAKRAADLVRAARGRDRR
ncbi:MAG: BtpA/SgcQ family protein [Phycisphaeraceae bacterium]|nr:BtpA/SgcQ family protein [Phycisphaeraceae bacterium]